MDRETRDFNGIGDRDILQQFKLQAMRGILETAIALPMRRRIGRPFFSDRQRGWAPHLARVFVTNINDFSWGISDRIVRPLGNIILLAVDRPRAAAALG